jgi:hypothetical protein
MTLEEYVENLNSFLEENPEAKELSVVYASDPEGNNWHYVHSTPCLIQKDENGWRLTTYTIEKANEVCIN